jgi:Ferritin-like domain
MPPTIEDIAIARFLQSIALAVAGIYDKVLPLLTDTTKPSATKFQAHYRDHATALAALAGPSAATLPNQALTLVLASQVQNVTDERGALTFSFGVENQVTETYAWAFGSLTSPEATHLVATMLTVAASHAAIMGLHAGLTSAALFPNGALEGSTVGDGTNTKLGFDPVVFPPG